MAVVFLIVGLAVGAAATWLVLRERRGSAGEARNSLANEFKALSAEALQQSTSTLLDLARTQFEGMHARTGAELDQRQQAVEQLVKPLKESLEKVDAQVQLLERSRQHAYGALTQQVTLLAESQERLRTETSSLVTALRAPATRGRWGEMQLRRTLELAGMLAHCDFVEQETGRTDDRLLRPDVVVKLAGGKQIVIDAKVPLQALLDAAGGDDDAHAECLQDFVRHVRDHMGKLSAKAYWQQFAPSPAFVVMFLPSEAFYRYAVEQDGTLLEFAPGQRVVLASPMTLITLLLSAAAGWREETLAEHARAVSELGQEMYERLATMGGHFAKLGNRLDKAVEAFNDTVGSLERRVLPAARRFPELGIPAKSELPEIAPIERTAIPLHAPELANAGELAMLPARDADAA